MAKAAKTAPTPECREFVLKLVAQSNEPLTSKQIGAELKGSFPISDKDLKALLDEMAAAGQLQKFAAATKAKERYWDRGIEVLAPRVLLAKLELKGPIKLADLKKLVLKDAKGLSDAQFQSAFEAQRAAGVVFEHPPLTTTSKTSKWATFAAIPSDYLTTLTKDLTKVIAKYSKVAATLSAAGVSAESLNAAGRRMIESAGMPSELLSAAMPAPSVASRVDLLALLSVVEPRARSGALVTLPDLRRAAGLAKTEFDREVLRLARTGRLVLHRHDFPAGLTDAERAALVTDEAGQFYVGVGLRQAASEPS